MKAEALRKAAEERKAADDARKAEALRKAEEERKAAEDAMKAEARNSRFLSVSTKETKRNQKQQTQELEDFSPPRPLKTHNEEIISGPSIIGGRPTSSDLHKEVGQ